jgi:hypothetical protein
LTASGKSPLRLGQITFARKATDKSTRGQLTHLGLPSPHPQSEEGKAGQDQRRNAHPPALALAGAGAQVVLHEALAAAHLVEGLLEGGDAAELLFGEPLPLPARLALEPPQELDLGAVAQLGRGRVGIDAPLGGREETLRPEAAQRLEGGEQGMVAGGRKDQPGALGKER